MSRYITTKADFTLRRKHKKGSGATIYENDYTTINPMPNALKGEYVIGDSNFVFTSRLGINGQKKHVRGKFVPNPSGSTDENGAWTIDTIIDSGITEETRIRLKPNYTSIRDFACYGSAVKLIQGTINGVITDFPAEMYLSDEVMNVYNGESGAGYGFDDGQSLAFSENILYNEYDIDITSINIQPESVYNPLRYFTLCGSSYTYIDKNGNTHDLEGFSVSGTASGSCTEDGKSVWIDQLNLVELSFEDNIKVTIRVLKNYDDDSLFYTYSDGEAKGHIRPKKKIIEDYFRDCDDFTAVLLNRDVKPIYTANFETPEETETGIKYEMKPYVWPSLYGGFNPDLSGPYYTYVGALKDLAEFYDEVFTDNMWRSLTHEAIKTLDWTYVSNSDGEVEDMSKIDTSRIEPITKIYGRQFDDLKRYADGIKSINTITYNQKSNTPDYTLTDVLENSGWETKTLKITTDNDIYTEALYSGMTSGYTASDANNEYLRRLKLNSDYLFSLKGTRRGLDTMLALFGFTPNEYSIHEYVCVFSATTTHFPHFCNDTDGKQFAYPLAKDVSTINKYKANFNSLDPYGDYCGIPVAEVGYINPDGEDYSYVVPWFSYGKNYDDGLYFQMHGGWGKRHAMDINLEIASAITRISEWGDVVPLYMETQARLKFAKDFDELLQQAFSEAHKNDVFYVTDISKITEDYSSGYTKEIEDASHYFILENEDMNQFLGYSWENEKYGWRSIDTGEITEPDAAGTLVLYLESIQDDTTGNNPHIGNGTYDDGMAYISGMSEIFNYSLINRNFIGIDDDTCSAITLFNFDVDRQEDNRKCWFFSDDYNDKYGKEAAYTKPDECGKAQKTISFKEVDVTDKICDVRNCNDSKPINGGCDESLFYEIAELLRSSQENTKANVGNTADEVYGRTTNLVPFDPENRVGKNGEAAANSIVNIKNIDVHFKLPNAGEEEKAAFRRYIENSVIPYLTQMIPSTSILTWEFDNDSSEDHGNPQPTPTPDPKPVHQMSYELVLNPNQGSITIDATGTACFTVNYVVKEDGREISNTPVTNIARWTSTDNSLVQVQNGCITGHNEDTQSQHSATVRVVYPAGKADPKTIVVNVRPAALPSLMLAVISPVDATATSISYTATSNAEVTVKYGSQTSTRKQGTFAISPNQSETQTVNHIITAYCTDHPSVKVTKTVVQDKAKPQPVTPTLSLTTPSPTIAANNTNITFRIESNTDTVVTYNGQSKNFSPTQGTTDGFTVPANETTDPIEHIITAECVGYSVTASVTVTQEGIEDPTTNFNVRPASLSFVDTGESKSLFIENVPNGYNWKVTDITENEWLSNISETAGTTDRELQISAGRNDGAARYGRLKVELLKDGTVKRTKFVELDQAAHVDRTFRVTQISNPFAYTGSSQLFKIINPEGHNWRVEAASLPNWITLPDMSGNETEKNMYPAASDNTGNIGGRDGYIIVIDTDDNNRRYPVYATQYGLNGVKINFDNEVKDRLSGLDFIRINGVSVYSVNYAFHMNGCMWYSYTQQVQTIENQSTATNCLPKHESYVSINSIEIPTWTERHFKCFEFHSDETFAGEDRFDWTGTTGLSMTEALAELNQVLGQTRLVKAIYNSTIILRANELPPGPTDTLQVQLRPDDEFEATASTATLMISSNTGWTISTNASWIVINDRTGSGTGEKTVEIKPNIGERRTGFIMVETTNGVQQEIEVKQRAPRTLEKRLVLGMDNMTIGVDETRANTAKFYATINGQDYLINQDVSSFADWFTTDDTIATVSGGHVTGVRPGQVEVWATYDDATSQDCSVNVQ